MTLAIRGDRASSLSMQLGPSTWLLGVARGFGRVDGMPMESALLARLRAECERRMRGPRFRRAVDRPQTAATAMLAVLARVNATLHACTASHDDYVTAAASLTAVVVVGRVAYVIHAGSTAAYLASGGDLTPLCPDDALLDQPIPLLTRAFAASAALDVSVSHARLSPGDALVLLGRRVGAGDDLALLLERAQRGDSNQQILIARFEEENPALREGRPAAPRSLAARAAAALKAFSAAVFRR